MINTHSFLARRKRLLSQLAPNSLAIIPAAQECTRSNDTEYHFRQNSDFFYLTGFNEPDAFLILSNQGDSSSAKGKSILLVRAKNELAEIWQGRRLGAEAAPSVLEVDEAYNIDDISHLLPAILDGHEQLYYSLGSNDAADAIVQASLMVCKKAPKQSMLAPKSIHDVNPIVHAMRLIKDGDEIALMQQSANISCEAHKKAMQICKVGMYEYQLEAIILHHFAMNGARFAAYNTIVGGGENACILHYTENQDLLKEGDLVLIDAGSEFQGYAADITRTFPVNGKFSEAQTALYNLVLEVQLACIDALVPGKTIADAMQLAVRQITQGLLALGILEGTLEACLEDDAHREFFMHGLGHYLGLDVHDVGDYKQAGNDKPLEEGMVLTVEPGIYISQKANVPEQYKGIGIRIEDNIVITSNGNTVMTQNIAKTVKDIEAIMAED